MSRKMYFVGMRKFIFPLSNYQFDNHTYCVEAK